MNQPAKALPDLPGSGSPSSGLFAARSSECWRTVFICVLLALAVWVVFGQTLRFEFVNYDDGRLIYENALITRGLGLNEVVRAFTQANAHEWYPLTSLSHMLDCELYGLNPGGHHLTNVLLHAATAILLFLLFRTMTGTLWSSAFAAAVFAVHPLRVESVAWVSERKDVLSGLFFVLTLAAYVRYVRKSKAERLQTAGHHPACQFRPLLSINYGLTLVLFALGLLSKTMLVTVPFVLLLLDYWPLGRLSLPAHSGSKDLDTQNGQGTPTIQQLIVEKIPFLLLAGAAGGVTILAQKTAIYSVEELSLFSRMGNALVAYAAYLGQMFYPVGLAVFYPHPGNRLSSVTVGIAALVLIVISLGVAKWRRSKPYLLVGWLWYLIMLLPVIGLLQVGSQARADRYTYLPQIGLYILIACGARDLFARTRPGRAALSAVAVLILVTLMCLSHAQTGHWRDSVSLWTHTLASTSENPPAHYDLGMALAARQKPDEAIPHYEQALLLRPDYTEARINLADAFNAQGRWDEAINQCELALRLRPDAVDAHINLGRALAAKGDLAKAVQHYQAALKFRPDSAEAHNDLGVALTAQGALDEAVRHCELAVQLKPNDANTHYNLGVALGAQEKWAEAARHYQRALELEPNDTEACNNLGLALAAQEKWNEAMERYARTLQLRPEYAEARYNLGVALATIGKLDEATGQFERALTLATAQGKAELVETIRNHLASLRGATPKAPTP